MRTIPSREEFLKGCNAYEEHEKRDSMYKVSTFLVSHFWGKFNEMADGLGVLLLTWNQAFYRYGIFNFDNLENCIRNNFYKLETFRKRIITDLQVSDENDIKSLFNNFLEALYSLPKVFTAPPHPSPLPPLGGEGRRGKNFWQTL